MESPDMTRCGGCGKEFTANEVVEFDGRTLCGTCMQNAVMNIKSGVSTGAAGNVKTEKAPSCATVPESFLGRRTCQQRLVRPRGHFPWIEALLLREDSSLSSNRI